MVRPYLVVIGPDGSLMGNLRVQSDSGFYRPTASSRSFRTEVQEFVSRWPEPVVAPFVLEVASGEIGTRYLFDVFPADGETLVVDFREHDTYLRVRPPQGLTAADLIVPEVWLSVSMTNQSEHIEVEIARQRTFEYLATSIDSLRYALKLPPGVSTFTRAVARWQTSTNWAGPLLRGRIDRNDGLLEDGIDLELASELRPLDLEVTWAGGANALEDYELTVESIGGTNWSESMRGTRSATDADPTLFGFAGSMLLSLEPSLVRALLPSTSVVVWNGVDPVALETGRHALSVRIVDAEGRPRSFRRFDLLGLSSGNDRATQDTDSDGRVRWYVNDGDYAVVAYEQRWQEFAPRGGPWRVTGDTTVEWEMP